MDNRLAHRTALVTGSTSNIGRAIAESFAREGAHVVVSGRDLDRGRDVVEAIRAGGGRADFVAADLDGSPAASAALAGSANEILGGRIDVLVNNAGIFPGSTTPAVDDDMFDRVYAVNVKAPFFLVQAVVPGMLESGEGIVVNLGSWVARLGLPVGALYASTKGALETLTRAWSAEFGPRGVRVNAISPGVIRPPHLAADEPFPGEVLMRGTPVGTTGPPQSIADAAVFLASDEASFIHGAVLDVDGGRVGVADAQFAVL